MEARSAAAMMVRDGKPEAAPVPFDALPMTIEPHRSLLTYYMLSSLVLGPFFIFGMAFGYFRYRTLRYDIDEQGITMRWGILFRREISLTYARIQDIQLSSNLVERWLGLAKIQLQTASGSSEAEMTIEGVREVDALRDFLYARTRGVSASRRSTVANVSHAQADGVLRERENAADGDELVTVLNAVAAELRALRLETLTDAGGQHGQTRGQSPGQTSGQTGGSPHE